MPHKANWIDIDDAARKVCAELCSNGREALARDIVQALLDAREVGASDADDIASELDLGDIVHRDDSDEGGR